MHFSDKHTISSLHCGNTANTFQHSPTVWFPESGFELAFVRVQPNWNIHFSSVLTRSGIHVQERFNGTAHFYIFIVLSVKNFKIAFFKFSSLLTISRFKSHCSIKPRQCLKRLWFTLPGMVRVRFGWCLAFTSSAVKKIFSFKRKCG